MFTQENRMLTIETPLGQDVLLLSGFSGIEEISAPFSYELILLSENSTIEFDDIIGQNVTVAIELANGEKRYFNGIIGNFSQKGGGRSSSESGVYLTTYTALLVPWFWLFTRSTNSRIFQDLSVPEIVEQVFGERGLVDYQLNLHGTYEKRMYCVQYRETDFNFISRILEEEGIFYFFTHEQGKHTMVLADLASEHASCPGQEHARCRISSSREEDLITSLEKTQEIRIGKYTTSDYNYLTPSTNLEVQVDSSVPLGPGEREVYDFPGEFKSRSRGEHLAGVRIEGEEAKITTIKGSSTCRAFAGGYKFELRGHYREEMNDSEYLLISVNHMAHQNFGVSGAEAQRDVLYSNSFICIPYETVYRPPMDTPKPVMWGSQTAFVVGPEGEEIYTDEYGRVKVQFHWDREGENNENSSCWMRVSQSMAGNRWGALFLPRIGHEVVVDFIEGDPDRPIITGQVYHSNNMPPYALPDEKTKSTFKSMSSPDGGGFNEIRFEDKKGEEQLFMHAEYNQDIRSKNDLLEWVGNDSHLIVVRDQLEKTQGDKHLAVSGDHNEKVDGTVSLEAGMDMQEKVGMSHALDAGQEIHLKAGMKVIVEANTQISLKVGGNFVDIGPAGVTIQGTMVMINSGGSAGSGSGSSPEAPQEPREADTAEPGDIAELIPSSPPSPTPQAQAFADAAESGTPLCDT